MKNILTLNKISKHGTEILEEKYNIGDNVDEPHGIMVRSAQMHDMEFSKNLLAISRAGAGVNNIPIQKCTEKGIVVFNTPGGNANAVKELTLCALFLASRNIVGGVEWAKTLSGQTVAKDVEKGKGQFAGHELFGKTLGVIGLGAIGGMVANVAVRLGMKVIGCDPFLSVEAAWNLNHNIIKATTYDEIYEKADYITLHVPATPDTTGMICAANIAKMKDGVKVINMSRGELIVASDVAEAMKSGKMSAYVTDFPSEEVLSIPGAIAIPHLGASTEESEDNCARMAAMELDDYLTNGNIKNSVNFPAVTMPRSGDVRICIFNDNVPDVISGISKTIAECGSNIENMTSKSRGNVAYNIVDISGDIDEKAVEKLEGLKGVFRVRIIR